jgi:beta-1,4-N-acetylglucosaminyltransferase
MGQSWVSHLADRLAGVWLFGCGLSRRRGPIVNLCWLPGAILGDRGSAGGSEHRPDVLLVCSSGGHLLQMHLLREAWAELDRVWVTFDKSDARSLLQGERVIYAFAPTARNIPNLLRNAVLAVRVVRRLRPRILVSTGAGLAVPFAWAGRLFGAKVVYVESLTRITEPSLSFRLIAPVVDRAYAQWPELAERLPRLRYVGSVLERA